MLHLLLRLGARLFKRKHSDLLYAYKSPSASMIRSFLAGVAMAMQVYRRVSSAHVRGMLEPDPEV